MEPLPFKEKAVTVAPTPSEASDKENTATKEVKQKESQIKME